MEKQRNYGYTRAAKQVDRMRRLYSEIGEPLAVDVIFDLYRHLDRVLALDQPKIPRVRGKKMKA